MKTKQEILQMTKKELHDYKWSEEIKESFTKDSDCTASISCSTCTNCPDCFNCFNCVDCVDCTDCTNCYKCYSCRLIKNLKYVISNVQFTKEEYEAKIKELNKS